MEKINRSYSNSQRTITSIAIDRLSRSQQDNIIDPLIEEGLIASNYKLYFVKKLEQCGAAAFLAAADKAKKFGKQPQKYFTSLMR